MENSFWHKQTKDEPLYPQLIWSKPVGKLHAGKLLIIGGNSHSFSSLALAYQASLDAGIGVTRVMFPDALQKSLAHLFNDAEFAASTPSGSFSQAALARLLDAADWADGVLLAGDFGQNSETTILLEKFIEKYSGLLGITGDAIEHYLHSSHLLNRTDTTAVVNLGQLQKIAHELHFAHPFISNMGLVKYVETLHELKDKTALSVLTIFENSAIVSAGESISTTPISSADKETDELVKIAAQSITWYIQNPTKQFEAYTTAIFPNLSTDK